MLMCTFMTNFKKKGLLFTVFIFCSFLLSVCSNDKQQPLNKEREYRGFLYVITHDGHVEITGYTGTSLKINIPEKIENRPVTIIRGRQGAIIDTLGAFENKGLTNVILPDSIRSIDISAFAGNNLSNLSIPNSLNRIHMWAFANNQISCIVIPDSVRYLHNFAFENNEIINVTFGSGLEHIGGAAFRNNKITNLAIPPNITNIGAAAFRNNKIIELNLTEGLISIGEAAFANNKITNINFPDSLWRIGYEAFANNQLTNITLPNNIFHLGLFNKSFMNNRLTEITIPANTTISNGAFIGNNIKKLIIGENVRVNPNPIMPPFEFDFHIFFHANESRAGTYIFEDDEWQFTPNE